MRVSCLVSYIQCSGMLPVEQTGRKNVNETDSERAGREQEETARDSERQGKKERVGMWKKK